MLTLLVVVVFGTGIGGLIWAYQQYKHIIKIEPLRSVELVEED